MQLNRRQFLGGSAVLAVAVVLPFPMLSSAKDYMIFHDALPKTLKKIKA